ncbi:MAG: glycosyltransferase family 4 protein [archaeon]
MKVQFVTLNRKENYKNDSGRGYHLPYNLIKKGHKLKYNFKENSWRFYYDYLAFKPDIVITTGLIAAVVGFFKKIKLIKKPVILDWNDYYTESMGKKYGIGKVGALEYLGVSFADLITTPSPYLKSICENVGKKCVVIPHGVAKEIDISKKANLPGKNKIKILYVGEISRYKRVRELIEAVKGLKCDLILVGGVTDKNIENAKLPENVHLLGKMPRAKVVEYLNAVDICVDTQDQDSSLKASEYVYKRKIILCRAGRKSYLFEHKKNAYLTDNFREGIKELINNRKLREDIKNNVSKLKVYSWEEIAEKYISLINNEFYF